MDAALLIKPTGGLISAWSRVPVSLEVTSVMLAALYGSLDTLLQTLGDPHLSSALVEAGDHRILALRADRQSMLFLVSMSPVDSRTLRREGRRILNNLAMLQNDRRLRPRAAPPKV